MQLTLQARGLEGRGLCGNYRIKELKRFFGGVGKKKRLPFGKPFGGLWALRDSNPRPSACKADALNQLS